MVEANDTARLKVQYNYCLLICSTIEALTYLHVFLLQEIRDQSLLLIANQYGLLYVMVLSVYFSDERCG